MKRIAIIANSSKPRAPEVLRRLARAAKSLDLALVSTGETARVLDCDAAGESGELFDSADAVLALGGDGTMLRAVRELNGKDKPVIGVNIGGLGFLTSVAEDELERAVECIVSDNFVVTVRSIAACIVERNGVETGRYHGLNEVLIHSGHLARIVTLDVDIDDTPITSYSCDGLIVSTPTGSTGHSLSAGGPILTPEANTFIINPICPHTLSSRPLVVPDHSNIRITIANNPDELGLRVDGQVGQALTVCDTVRVRRSSRTVRFIHLPGHSYFAVLRHKLNWCGSTV